MRRETLLLFPLLSGFFACATTSQVIPASWLSVPQAASIRSVALGPDGPVANSADSTHAGAVHIASNRLMAGDKPLTDAFAAIDSFDVSESRGEVVFSARREKDFDIALVALDGSKLLWLPNDPADELAVQWAPRGSKVSYVIRTSGGDVVRTLHVPTSFQFTVDFPWSAIHDLAWDDPAERFAVAYSTPDASDRVDVLTYSGGARKTTIPPSSQLAVEVEPFGNGAVVLRPQDLHYNEKVPLVVWLSEDFRWNDARAALQRNARVAMVIARQLPDPNLWKQARETPWIDSTHAFLVGGKAPEAISIAPDPAIPAGRYRREGRYVAVAPAGVQSFAAGFITEQLKRTGPPNGSSR